MAAERLRKGQARSWNPQDQAATMTIAELKELIESAGRRHDDCLEKADLQQRAREVLASQY